MVTDVVPIIPLSTETRRLVEAVLRRAGEDIHFRDRLLREPVAALQDSGLSPEDARVLGSMKRVALEEWGIDVRRFRAFLRDNGYKYDVVAKGL